MEVISVPVCEYFEPILTGKIVMDFLTNSPPPVFHCMVQIMLSISHYGPLRILALFVIGTISSLLFAFCFHLFTFSSHISFSASPSHVSMVLTTFLPFSHSLSKIFLVTLVLSFLITCFNLSNLFPLLCGPRSGILNHSLSF